MPVLPTCLLATSTLILRRACTFSLTFDFPISEHKLTQPPRPTGQHGWTSGGHPKPNPCRLRKSLPLEPSQLERIVQPTPTSHSGAMGETCPGSWIADDLALCPGCTLEVARSHSRGVLWVPSFHTVFYLLRCCEAVLDGCLRSQGHMPRVLCLAGHDFLLFGSFACLPATL